MRDGDTIVAIATAAGRGGIGIVRASGATVREIARAITAKTLTPRRAALSDFLAADGSAIDQGIALLFTAPHSFTGEDVLELHGHGGPAVLELLLRRCVELGARLARPGEFTERAFLNDKLDLAQAESVADLIDAASGEAARSAVRSLRGEFSAAVNALVQQLIALRMLVEATLDFPEEEIDFLETADARGKLQHLRADLAALRAQASQGRLLREGVRVVLAGAPNVGKSSLMNRLAGDDIAIVTAIPGTTRDALRQDIVIEGVRFTMIDTAGLRETDDEVERIGIARSWQALHDADIALTISEGGEPEQQLQALPQAIVRLHVVNKIDLTGEPPGCADGTCRISAKTGAGIDVLKTMLLEYAGWQSGIEPTFIARTRHLDALDQAAQHLAAAADATEQAELLAEELRQAQNAMNSITGEFCADDLLGEIFSRFCIGK